MRVTPEQLPAVLSRGLASIYLVSGDEPLLADEAGAAIRNAARAAGFADRRVFFIERGFSWEELDHAAQALSLFAERRLFELRMPGGKPDKGASTLEQLAVRPPPDVISLIITGKLDKKTSDAAWVRAIEKHGVWIPLWPVDAAAMPDWLRARAKAMRLDIEPAAAQLIVARVEGNLLAAQQELEKLRMLQRGQPGQPDQPISVDLVMRSVGDSARYDVFQLAQAAAAGDAARASHVLAGLKSEGVEPSLILWALVRELRGLWQARERERLRSNARGSGWNLVAAPSRQALARLGKLPLARLMVQSSHVDRVIKGIAAGDAWSAIMGLTCAFAGALQATPESGRVGQ